MNINTVTVREDTIENALQVHSTIPEFTKPADVEYFQNRYKDKLHCILVVYMKEEPAGYLIAYDKFSDGSTYCWMVGVNPNFRRKWILSELMWNFEKLCREKEFHTIHVKTRKSREGMAYYLDKTWYIPQNPQLEVPPVDDDILLLQKNI